LAERMPIAFCGGYSNERLGVLVKTFFDLSVGNDSIPVSRISAK
jgi:hypothetical protein